MIYVIIVLIIVAAALLIYNISINKKIQDLSNVHQKVTSLNVLQDFMNTIGEEETVDKKIEKINNALIEKYQIKYSTIVAFDGTEYVIKATNVNEKHWDTLRNLQNEEIFQDSITTATPKSITVEDDNEKLPYQKLEFGRAKSAIFFPLYIDNVYIGYWILESGEKHGFDNIDNTILEVVKDNILTVLKTVSYQAIVESLQRRDLYSDLNNVEYLYGKGRRIVDRYPTSAVCMFKLINIDEVNENIGRNLGNQMITQVCEYIRNNISEEYLFVRYMGPKFIIFFSGIDTDGVTSFVQDLKNNVEELEIIDEDDYEEDEDTEEDDDNKIIVNPKLNFVISTYYKGTALESLNKRLEQYLDEAEEDESEINLI